MEGGKNLPVTIEKLTLTANQEESSKTDWIDVSTCKRVRLQIPKLPGGVYTFGIAYGTFDPATNTPVIPFGVDYMCGNSERTGFVGESPIFVIADHLGVNQIQVEFTNLSGELTQSVYLVKET